MKKNIIYLLFGLVVICVLILCCVNIINIYSNKITDSENINSYSIDELSDIIKEKKRTKKLAGEFKQDKPEEFAKYFSNIKKSIGAEKDDYPLNYTVKEINKAKKSDYYKSSKSVFTWDQRGPVNVGGRTRAIVVDPDDPDFNTWYAGTAGGGILKTIDGGDTWENISGDLPNLAITTIAMAPSNHDIMYLGTGEGFGLVNSFVKGSGIFKTIDRGISWIQLDNTAESEDFEYVNKIIISLNDENIALAATNTGIFKSTDGFQTWNMVFQQMDSVQSDGTVPAYVQGLAATDDFSYIHAAIKGYGVATSSDMGETWKIEENIVGKGDRFEVAVSPANQKYVYLTTEDRYYNTELYVSLDNGNEWKKLINTGTNYQFHGGQGWYDMTIAGHPYDSMKVYLGGVNLGLFEFDLAYDGKDISNIDTINTGSFLSFVNFQADYFNGCLSMESPVSTEIEYSDMSSLKIVFGSGISQKAHRFTVPDESTSGVAYSQFSYQDYIEVPFQVWDTDNNRQLMVSFRDQEQDGEFNLYERTGDAYGQIGREYLFVHALDYDPNNPHAEISSVTRMEPVLYKQLIFVWPNYAAAGSWDPTTVPESEFIVEFDNVTTVEGEPKVISDAYGYYTSTGMNRDLHPDHHMLLMVPVKPEYKIFDIIDASDGGIAISKDEGNSWTTKETGYVTSQFYGATKMRDNDVYFGGTQDNGTFISPLDQSATSETEYTMCIGGDGFEVLWHYQDPDKLIGGMYYNTLLKSEDGGQNWQYSYEGLPDGPFVTRLSSSKSNPDIIYAVTKEGVGKSEDFADSWKVKTVGNKWMDESAYYSLVRVSKANHNVVWAGGAISNNYNLYFSTDAGETYSEIGKYNEVELNNYISNIATHPIDESTAYILLSNAKAPKILRTEDMGQTWEDISGFDANEVSDNGFPDVAVLSLLVMPHDPNIIWAGTEIGIFESQDNGQTWSYLNSDLPPVSVWQMSIVDDQIVIATYGRGIWTASIPELEYNPILLSIEENVNIQLECEHNVDYEKLDIFINNNLVKTIDYPETGELVTIDIETDLTGDLRIFTQGYVNGQPYQSNMLEIELANTTGINPFAVNNDLNVYPNPTSGNIYFDINENIGAYLEYQVISLNGTLVSRGRVANSGHNSLDLSNLNNGTYFIKIFSNEKIYSQKIQIIH